MTKVLPSFYRGREASINNLPITNGAIYVATDTRNLFFDVSNDTRIKISGDGGDVNIDELNFYNKDEINAIIEDIKNGLLDIVSYEVTLLKENWTQEDNYYLYYYNNDLLILGKDGITSPLVTYTDVNREEYHYIYDANATRGEGIVFRAVQLPTEDIDIIITDFGYNKGMSSAIYTLSSLTISRPPAKLTYVDGEAFDPRDMIVLANYIVNEIQSSSKRITDYTYSPTTLTYGIDHVTISYTEGEKTVTAVLSINVVPALESITISKLPDKLDYEFNETFNAAGMIVTANYSNLSSKLVTNFIVTPMVLNLPGQLVLTVSYTELGINKTTTLIVNVANLKTNKPYLSGTLTYNGNNQVPTWVNYDTDKMTIGGSVSAIDAGTYQVIFTPRSGYSWSDGTNTPVTVNWVISKAKINVLPSLNGSLVYNGSSLSPTWSNYNTSQLTIDGTTSGITAGTYMVGFTPTKNYLWWDNTTSKKSLTWIIGNAVIATIPYLNGLLYYNGTKLTPSWNSYNSNQLTIGGTTSATNVGIYTASFTPKANYQWNDGTTSAKTASWNIAKAVITVEPSQNGTLTFTGNALTPSWNNYNSSLLIIGGTRTAVNAGTYVATFTPTSNYAWSDAIRGSSSASGTRNVNWYISKASGAVSISPTSLDLKVGESATVRATRAGDGNIVFVNYYDKYTSGKVNGTTITITGKAVGTELILIGVGEGTNHEIVLSGGAARLLVKVSPAWEWGNENSIGDDDWWKGLLDFLQNKSTYAQRQALIGKTKGIKFSTSVLGSSLALFRCIDADRDRAKTLTFLSKNGFNINYGDNNASNYLLSTGADYCEKLFQALSLTITNRIYPTTKEFFKDGFSTVKYTSTFMCWLPSAAEVGMDRYISNSSGAYLSTVGEYTPGVTSRYAYFTNNASRIKKAGDSSSTAVRWDTRTIGSYSGNALQDKVVVPEDGSSFCQVVNSIAYFAPCFVFGEGIS